MPVLMANGRLVLFIHVPKTAGTSVEGLLESYGTVFGVHQPAPKGLPCNVQHFHAPLIEQVFSRRRAAAGPLFDFVFMTVRDPIDRLMSEFYYRLRFTPGVRTSRWPGRSSEVSVDGWVTSTLDRVASEPYLFDNHIRPQHEFRAFDATVFKVEHGVDRIREALDDVVGLRGEVPPRQKTSRRQRGLRASPMAAETMARVREFYVADYDTFGYGDASGVAS